MAQISPHTKPNRDLVVFVLSVGLLVSSLGRAAADFGDALPGLTPEDQEAFEEGLEEFTEEETVEEGLGPVFNDVSCAACHSSPAVGGDSTVVETRFGTLDKKQFDPLISGGGSLLQTDGIGPANGCPTGETLPPTTTIVAGRKTTPLFGAGLIEAIPDAQLQQLAAQQPPAIKGRAHQVKEAFSPQTRVGRFGHKAQVATLLQFSGDAYLNEMGITSTNFRLENCPNGDCSLLSRCDLTPDPEDNGEGVEAFAAFMRLLAPPPRGAITPEVQAGEQVFSRLGCAGCHVPTWTTGSSPVAALNGVTFHPYSDFLLHDMGPLGDGIEQGQAGGTEMRTMPLWGLRARKSFLHDGRTDSLTEAIGAHAGQGQAAKEQFEALSGPEVRQLLEFLESL
jgi:CxxC motif-containing protein (DUF1111 family)